MNECFITNIEKRKVNVLTRETYKEKGGWRFNHKRQKKPKVSKQIGTKEQPRSSL